MEICYCKCNHCNKGMLWFCLFKNLFFITQNKRTYFYMNYKHDKSVWIRLPAIFRYILPHYVMNSIEYD